MAQPQAIQPHPSLSKVAIFGGLSPDALKRIERRCVWRNYEPGEAILDYLDASDDVFIIGTGEVRVTIYSLASKAVSFRELGAGEVFGEYPANDGGPRSASVEARTNCLIAGCRAPRSGRSWSSARSR
jgi:CRP/FNR family transcriptional regulator, cyclic AMP receptor protein